jgi:4-hydroxybenzoate polyprenyltransferase
MKHQHRFFVYWDLVRPFTLLPPLLGMLSGAACAFGAAQVRAILAGVEPPGLGFERAWAVLLGAVMAATLNAGSNSINQLADLENDRINKPQRPLPSGRLDALTALRVGVLFYLVALVAAWFVGVPRGGTLHECFWWALGGAAASLVYSVPPLRTKRWAWPAQTTIAVSRGMLLRVCGWSCVAATIGDPEPWFTGAVFMFFLLGASATKDFADLDGDRAAGCRTWPVAHGTTGAARRVAPFLVLPWLLLPLGATLRHPLGGALMAGNGTLLVVLGSTLAVYGIYIAYLMLRNPHELAEVENHPSWVHMYRMMMVAQLGLISAYLYSGLTA